MEVKEVSPRPKSEASKRNRFELRLNDEMAQVLEECAIELNITKTEVINRGILLVQTEIEKK